MVTDACDEPGESGALDGSDVELWTLSPGRRVLHWTAVLALLAVVVAITVLDIARNGPLTAGWLLVLVSLLLIVQLLRAVVAVWLDPTDGTLVLFRAAGGSLRTQTSRVRRLDHGGPLANVWRLVGRRRRPVRVVTENGTAALSMFFPDPYDIADELARGNPDIQIDL